MLLLTATMFTIGWSPTVYAEPQLGQGCQCHNNGIALWFNGTGFNEFSSITVAAGGSFKLNVTSANYAATGTVPGVQQWMTGIGDTGKFTISPQNVTVSSPLNISKIKVNSTISAFYKITAPTTGGTYHIAISALGQTQGIGVIVQGGATTTTTSTGSSQTGTTSSTGSQTTTQSSGSTTQSQSSTQTTTSPPTTSIVTTTTTSTKPVPDVTYYGGEFALIVVGFSVFLAVLLMSYRKK